MGPTLEEMYHCPAGHYTYHFWTGNIEISIGDQHFELRQNDQDYALRRKIGDTEAAERHKWFQSLEDSNGGQQWLGEPRSL